MLFVLFSVFVHFQSIKCDIPHRFYQIIKTAPQDLLLCFRLQKQNPICCLITQSHGSFIYLRLKSLNQLHSKFII